VLVTPGRPVHLWGQAVTGIVKKVAKRGFGIIGGADGSKIPFILADVAHRRLLKPGQTVLFSVRRGSASASASRCNGLMGTFPDWTER
jgi:cold shock CspA family protein